MEMPRTKTHKVWTWSIMSVFMALIVYVLLNRPLEKPFARRRETLELRSQFFECSADFRREVDTHYKDCAPRRCGRLVSDTLLQEHEVDALLEMFEGAMALTGGGSGGATIFELHTGALSKGETFVYAFGLGTAGENLLRPELVKVYEVSERRRRRSILAAAWTTLNGIFFTL